MNSIQYIDAAALCKGLGVRWRDYLDNSHNRADFASLRQQLPGVCLIHDGTGKTLLHPDLATLVARWATSSRKPVTRGFVYLIRCCGRYKIGKSKHPEIRLDELNTPYQPELVFCVEVSDMHSVESWLHEKFASKRAWREWFDLSQDEVVEAALLASEGP